jgi:ketosteroid isomerase-like protein
MNVDLSSAAIGVVIGIVVLVALRIALKRALLWKLRRDVAALAGGDHRPLLKGYADDAVLVFADGDHRWSGTYRGRDEIGTFLADFVRVGLKGEITDLWMAGWPWTLTILVAFDDHADDEQRNRVYDNHTILKCRTRWGKIVHQEDFYFDTVRMVAFDRNLTSRGL